MTKLTALCYFVLSLFGLDIGAARYEHRVSASGTETLYSRAEAHSGVARFECVRSASGRCHYALFAADCDPADGCRARPLKRFHLDAGAVRNVTGVAGFHLCVGTGAADAVQTCAAPTG